VCRYTSAKLARRCAGGHADDPHTALLLHAGSGLEAVEAALVQFNAWRESVGAAAPEEVVVLVSGLPDSREGELAVTKWLAALKGANHFLLVSKITSLSSSAAAERLARFTRAGVALLAADVHALARVTARWAAAAVKHIEQHPRLVGRCKLNAVDP
jgi:hypothetical protein